MELTRNEIAVILNYYHGLEFDIEDRMETIKTDCIGLIDTDLYETQLDRCKTTLKEYQDRIEEMTTELEKL